MNDKDYIFYGVCTLIMLVLLCAVTITLWDRMDSLEARLDDLQTQVEVVTTTEAATEVTTETLIEPSDDEIQISIGED